MITMNKILTLTIALAVLLLPELSFAQNNETLSEQLCELRQMFCGGAGTALISVTIIIIGLALFSGKIHWSFVMIMSVAIIIFVNAHNIADMILLPEDSVDCVCL